MAPADDTFVPFDSFPKCVLSAREYETHGELGVKCCCVLSNDWLPGVGCKAAVGSR